MNDEIKEILDKFDKVLKNYELDKKFGQMSVDSIYHLFPSEMVAIKDCITNLQQELEDYKDTETYSKKFLYKANKDRLNANLKLIEENERLKEKNNELEKAQKNAVECIKQSIKESQLIFGWNDIQRYHDYEMNELLNILDVRSYK